MLNGTSDANRGPALAGYLEFHGLAASAPRQKPEGTVPADTVITVYNGAEDEAAGDDRLPREDASGSRSRPATDPAVRADIVISIGRDTPDLEPPPSS